MTVTLRANRRTDKQDGQDSTILLSVPSTSDGTAKPCTGDVTKLRILAVSSRSVTSGHRLNVQGWWPVTRANAYCHFNFGTRDGLTIGTFRRDGSISCTIPRPSGTTIDTDAVWGADLRVAVFPAGEPIPIMSSSCWSDPQNVVHLYVMVPGMAVPGKMQGCSS